MLDERFLTNAVVAWVEETLDRDECTRGVLVVRAGEDAPQPSNSQKPGERHAGGSSTFVTVDLTGDELLDREPLVCETIDSDGVRTRTYLTKREVAFSISVFRHLGYDVAIRLITDLERLSTREAFFAPHGISFHRAQGVTRLRELIHDQWEHRAQFSVFFRYFAKASDEISPIERAALACERDLSNEVIIDENACKEADASFSSGPGSESGRPH